MAVHDKTDKSSHQDLSLFFERRCESLGEPPFEVILEIQWPENASHGSWSLDDIPEKNNNNKEQDSFDAESKDSNEGGGPLGLHITIGLEVSQGSELHKGNTEEKGDSARDDDV
ncbi:unnamed protein product [Calypogeia fissa]